MSANNRVWLLSSRWTIAVSTFTSSRRLASSARMRSCWLRKTPMWPVRLHCHRPGINRLNNDRIGQQPSIDRIVTQHCRVFRQLCWSGHDQRTGDRLGCREAEQVRIRIDCRWLSCSANLRALPSIRLRCSTCGRPLQFGLLSWQSERASMPSGARPGLNMPHLFISHSSKDDLAAEAMCMHLVQRISADMANGRYGA
jgi:hypothetical protein